MWLSINSHREMQIKPTMTRHHKLIKIARIKKKDHTKLTKDGEELEFLYTGITNVK